VEKQIKEPETNLETIQSSSWQETFSKDIQEQSIDALENGKVLYFPKLSFPLSKEEETAFFTPSILDGKHKNISYNSHTHDLKGTSLSEDSQSFAKSMMHRYASSSRLLLNHLFPAYESYLIFGKTSFRPIEVEGRKTSCLKDDTLLHLDAFPSNPLKGNRILRVFTNVNPFGKPRVWRIGEPMQNVLQKFAPKVTPPIWGMSSLLKMIGVTKDLRTLYDHYMLKIHDGMKLDAGYQENVLYEEVLFPAGSTWMTFSDQVSHAAMAGQYLFEQTCYLPVAGQKHPSKSPLKSLEKILNKTLV